MYYLENIPSLTHTIIHHRMPTQTQLKSMNPIVQFFSKCSELKLTVSDLLYLLLLINSSLTVLYLMYVLTEPSFFSVPLFWDQVLIASFSCCTDTFSWFLIWKSWSVAVWNCTYLTKLLYWIEMC